MLDPSSRLPSESLQYTGELRVHMPPNREVRFRGISRKRKVVGGWGRGGDAVRACVHCIHTVPETATVLDLFCCWSFLVLRCVLRACKASKQMS